MLGEKAKNSELGEPNIAGRLKWPFCKSSNFFAKLGRLTNKNPFFFSTGDALIWKLEFEILLMKSMIQLL
jgi:hypothetical protein